MAPVRRVLVVSKTHLDLGFTDGAAAVRRRYLTEFVPRAMATAAALRRRGGPERLVWTTGSWILTEALDAADAPDPDGVAAAVAAGDLAWHALPFTTHTELADRSLIDHGLSLSSRLDERFDRRTRAAKLTDVPGHTRGLVSLLAARGVDLLHVGVNPAWPAPRVPAVSRWVDPVAPGAPALQLLYAAGAYGDVTVLPGTEVAVAVVMTGDNLGPPTPDDVVATFDRLRDRFPGAEVVAGTLDDVAEALRPVATALPVVDGELGDRWIHGVASDPPKVRAFRALSRQRAGWLGEGRATPDEPALHTASTALLCVAEHTWGLDQKTWWPELGHWSAAELASVRDREDTRRFEASWAEQRAYLDRYVELLQLGGRADLAAEAAAVLAATPGWERAPGTSGAAGADAATPVRGATPVAVGAEVGLAGWRLAVGVDGALVAAVAPSGAALAGPVHPLGRLGWRSHDAAEYEACFAALPVQAADADWARWDDTKPGLEHSDAVARTLAPAVTELRCGDGALVAVLAWPGADDRVAVPARTELTYRPVTGADGGPALEVSLRWWGRPAARWPETVWWTFDPSVGDGAGPAGSAWRLVKLGEPVDPAEVVPGGAVALHAADAVEHPAVRLSLPDAPLVAPGRPDPLPAAVPADHDPAHGGWHVLVLGNLWGTNFPMWCPGEAEVRVLVEPR